AQHIKSLGKRAGITLNPSTSEETLRYLIPVVDQILVMSVNPGFGGQSFIEEMLGKVAAFRKMIDASGRDITLEIDGGIAPDTIERAVRAGARAFVAGNAIFTKPDYGAAIRALREEGQKGLS
ncbi:MAG TPA: ribulose-phosphate 3-epimerase, partial [Polyangiaceae bacterium]